MHRSKRPAFTILLVVVACMSFGARSAEAQGVWGVVADPIDGVALDRAVRQLGLSPEQAAATEALYEGYLDAWSAFRSGPLARFDEANPNFAGSSSSIDDDLDGVRKTERELRALQLEHRALDERFFDELAAMLTEEQLEHLPRVRADRRRWRLLHGPARVRYAPPLDLDLGVRCLDLVEEWRRRQDDRIDAETAAAIDAMVHGYEASLLEAAQSLHDFALEARTDLTETLLAGRAVDPEADFAVSAAAHRAMQDRQAELVHAVSAAHRRFLEAVAPLLDLDASEQLWQLVLETAYPEVRRDPGVAASETARLLTRDDLDPETRGAIDGLRAAHFDAVRAVRTRAMDNEDAFRLSNASHGLKMMLDDGYEYESDDTYRERRHALVQRLERVDRDTLESLAGLLDRAAPGRFRVADARETVALDPRLARGLSSSVMSSDEGVTYGYDRIPLRMLTNAFGAGRTRPRPIEASVVRGWIRRFGLSDDFELVAEMLHERYLDAFDALEASGALSAMQRQRERVLRLDDDGLPVLPTEADVRAVLAAEEAGRTAVLALDHALCADFAVTAGAAIPPEALERLQRECAIARLVEAPPDVSYPIFALGSAGERIRRADQPAISVVALVPDAAFDDDTRVAIDAAIDGHLAAALGACERLAAAQHAFDEARAVIMARSLRFDPVEGLVAQGIRDVAAVEAAADRLGSVLDELQRMNQEARIAMEAVLPPQERGAFSAAFKRASWPVLYRDRAAQHDAIESALARRDLDPATREALGLLGLEYRQAYEDIMDRMIADPLDRALREGTRDERAMLNERTQRRLQRLVGRDPEPSLVGADDPPSA